MNNIYKTDNSKTEILKYYNRFLNKYNFVKETDILTDQGLTHVLECGEENHPTVILLHGSGMSSAMWLGELQEYASHFHVYAVDIPGEPGKSFELQMSLEDDSYPNWLKNLMEKLGVSNAFFVGLSLGGWMALKFAVKYPEYVKKLVLISTSGVGRQKASFLAYAIFYSLLGDKGVEELIKKINGGRTLSEEMLGYQKCIRNNFNYRMGKIPVFSDQDLKRLPMPVSVFAGEKDIMLSSKETVERIKRLLPAAEINFLKGEGHAIIKCTDNICSFLLKAL